MAKFSRSIPLAAGLAVATAVGVAAQEPASGPGGSLDPLDLDLTYIVDLAANVSGGVDRGVVGMGNLDAIARIDGDALLGWEGSTVYLYGLGNHGGEVTGLTGDAQVASNIQAPTSIRLYEAWIQQNLSRANLSVLAGLYDVNSEFDVLREAAVFLNSSFGIGAEFAASGRNGPSIFPVTSLGARVQWHPTHRWYLQGAVLDGVPGDPVDPGATAVHLSSEEGILWVTEVGYLHHSRSRSETGEPELGRGHVHDGIDWRVSVGAWGYSRAGRIIGAPGRVSSHPGVYALAELYPYREEEGTRSLGIFARAGIADDRTTRFGAYTGFGFSYQGLVPGRGADVAGLGVATAYNGAAYESSLREAGIPVSEAETTVELTYRAHLAPQLFVQPDLQLILEPNADPRIPDAWLFTLRLGLQW
ncbi:MAG: carbohydrate porin [Longimicrobiales bacterium]|nr:carbohydrate porin [Longimicrobiales bacterium]